MRNCLGPYTLACGGEFDKEGIRGKCKAWVGTQGYPLEMRVSQAFEDQGIHTDHTRVYEDPDEGTYREIDVIAYIDSDLLSLHIVVECKVSHDMPWVIFSTEGSMFRSDSSLLAVPCTLPLYKLPDFHSILYDPNIYRSPLLNIEDHRHGYNVVQAFKDSKQSKDLAFAALRTVIKAATTLARRTGERSDELIFYMPIIVVDGRSGRSPAWPPEPLRPATATARANPSPRPATGCCAPPWSAPPTTPAAKTPSWPASTTPRWSSAATATSARPAWPPPTWPNAPGRS
jgi:hypothetical protein